MGLNFEELLNTADQLLDQEGPLPRKSAVMYSQVLGFLASDQLPNPAIHKMAEPLGAIIDKNLVLVVPVSGPDALQIVVRELDGLLDAIIFLPFDWIHLFRDNPIYHLGSVLYTGSQAVDYYNHLLVQNPGEAMVRGRAYEAEFLNMVRDDAPEYPFSPYQLQVLEDFPEGLFSELSAHLLYESAPVEVIEA
jgi:hypothetical protein